MTTDRKATDNSTFAIGEGSCSANTFVVKIATFAKPEIVSRNCNENNTSKRIYKDRTV